MNVNLTPRKRGVTRWFVNLGLEFGPRRSRPAVSQTNAFDLTNQRARQPLQTPHFETPPLRANLFPKGYVVMYTAE